MADAGGGAQDGQDRILAQRFTQALASAFAADTDLVRRGWCINTCCLVEIGTEQILLTIRDGRPVVAERVPPLASWEFALRARADAWEALWQPLPKAGWHDIFALAKRGAMQIEGSLQPLMAHLQYYKDLVTLPRGKGGR